MICPDCKTVVHKRTQRCISCGKKFEPKDENKKNETKLNPDDSFAESIARNSNRVPENHGENKTINKTCRKERNKWFRLAVGGCVLFSAGVFLVLLYHFAADFYFQQKEKGSIPKFSLVQLYNAGFDGPIDYFEKDSRGNILKCRFPKHECSQKTGSLKWRFFQWSMLQGSGSELVPEEKHEVRGVGVPGVVLIQMKEAPLIRISFSDPTPFMILLLILSFSCFSFIMGNIRARM